jgi:type II secretory ATPase GspE/PulE/Tfp pilus assembly ATPase PilB-like protein
MDLFENLDLNSLWEKYSQQALNWLGDAIAKLAAIVGEMTSKLGSLMEPHYHIAQDNPIVTGVMLLALAGIPLTFIKSTKPKAKNQGQQEPSMVKPNNIEKDKEAQNFDQENIKSKPTPNSEQPSLTSSEEYEESETLFLPENQKTENNPSVVDTIINQALLELEEEQKDQDFDATDELLSTVSTEEDSESETLFPHESTKTADNALPTKSIEDPARNDIEEESAPLEFAPLELDDTAEPAANVSSEEISESEALIPHQDLGNTDSLLPEVAIEEQNHLDYEKEPAPLEFEPLNESLELDAIAEPASTVSNDDNRDNENSILSEEMETTDSPLPEDAIEDQASIDIGEEPAPLEFEPLNGTPELEAIAELAPAVSSEDDEKSEASILSEEMETEDSPLPKDAIEDQASIDIGEEPAPLEFEPLNETPELDAIAELASTVSSEDNGYSETLFPHEEPETAGIPFLEDVIEKQTSMDLVKDQGVEVNKDTVQSISPNPQFQQEVAREVIPDSPSPAEPQIILPVKKETVSIQKPTKYSYLVQQGLMTEEKLASFLTKAEKDEIDEETYILESGEVKRNDLGLSLANFHNLPYKSYNRSAILPKKILGGLNKNFLAKHFWIPIHSTDSKVVILINDPANLDKTQNIKHIFPKREIEFNVGLKADIIDFLNSVLEQDGNYLEPVKSEDMSALINTLQEESEESQVIIQSEEDVDSSSTINESDNTIIRLVNKILIDAYKSGVSDIHIEPGIDKDNVVIRFRKDGECATYEEIPFLYKSAIISRVKIMSHLDIAERRVPQDGKFKMRYENNDIEFRVATCPTVGGNEDVVMRILAKNEQLPLEKMNFSEQNLNLINKSLAKPYGLILVVGPTGSGKTTTLHSCLDFLNTPRKKIWTVEDPVEITQKGIRQVQTLEKKGLNFARAMRSFLRGDPDVIMVGEMRDTETASIGLEASLTGHLVLSTLHTNSAPETITRLLDMGMNPLNFADSLILVVAQRLVKTLCQHCCENYHPTIEEFDILANEYGEDQFQKLNLSQANLTLKKPAGCDLCDGTGYLGRTAIHELLEGTPAIKRMVVKQASADELRKKAFEEGMTTLKQDGISKVLKGQCDLRQVLSICMS